MLLKIFYEGDIFMDKFREEEQEFINLLLTTSEKIQPIINKIIEYTLCLKAMNDYDIYDITHEFDAPWDYSGELVKTGKELTVTSIYTLEEVSRMYTGDKTASYMSGCGFFYDTFSQDVEANIESFLYIYVEHYIDECFRHGLFPNYLTEDFVYEDEGRIDSNLVTDTKTELYCSVFETEYDEEDPRIPKNLPTEIGNERICDVYKKYEFIFRRYQKDVEKYYKEKELHERSFIKQAEERKASLVVPAKFKHPLTKKTEEDRKLFKELKKTFSKEDLSILFGLGVLNGSNSVKDEFISLFNGNRNKNTMIYPDIFDDYYLEEAKSSNWIKIIDEVIKSEVNK